MAIRLTDGSQFIHIPKTGGSWVSEVLHANGLVAEYLGHKHADYDLNLFHPRISPKRVLPTYCKVALNRLEARFTGKKRPEPRVFRFAFVRHPLSWYESHWKFMQGLDWIDWGVSNSCDDWHPCSILNGLGSPDFNQFIRNVVQVRPGYVSELFFAFTKQGIDFIGKNENLRDDLMAVMAIRGLKVDEDAVKKLKRVNESKVKQDKIQWDPDLRDLVMRLEMPALVHYGYLTPEERDKFGIPHDLATHAALSGYQGPAVPHWYPECRGA